MTATVNKALQNNYGNSSPDLATAINAQAIGYGEYLEFVCLEGYGTSSSDYGYLYGFDAIWDVANQLGGQPGYGCFTQLGGAFDCTKCQYQNCTGGGSSVRCVGNDGATFAVCADGVGVCTVSQICSAGNTYACPYADGSCP